MAAPIQEYTIIEVRKPNVGENKPADVTADIVIDTTSELQHATGDLGMPVGGMLLMGKADTTQSDVQVHTIWSKTEQI